MKNDDQEDQLTTITELLQKLELQQQIINTQIKSVKNTIETIKGEKESKHYITNKSTKFKGSRLSIGDKVQIKNPKQHQQNTGTIIGQTNTGYARVRTKNGSIIRRLPFNLIKLK